MLQRPRVHSGPTQFDIAYRRRVAAGSVASHSTDGRAAQCSRPCRPCSTAPSSPSACSRPRPTRSPGALAAPVVWAHTSDLRRPDAVPRRRPRAAHDRHAVRRGVGGDEHGRGGATSGRADAAFADAYVRRLREAGVAALGFGTEVIRAGTPDALVDACTAPGAAAVRGALPGAVHRDRAARRRPARRGRVRPTGLGARRAARDLARRPAPRRTLGDPRRALAPTRHVGRTHRRDAGRSTARRPLGGLGQPALGEVVGEARSMLRRGQRASRILLAGESDRQPRSASRCRHSAAAAPCAACSRSATPPSSTRPAARS